MEFLSFIVLILSQMALCKIGSTLNQANDLSIEDTVIHLKQKITQVEERLSSFENTETSDLVQKLSVAVREAEKRILEDKNQLLARIDEIETKAKDARNDLSVKLHEVEERASKREEEIMKRVSEVEMRCVESTKDISSRLQDAEVRFLRKDTHLLVETQQAQEKYSEAIEKVRIAEQEVASAFESKTDILQVKMNETRETLNSFVASHRETENVIRLNISSSTEKLRHLNDSLSSRLESLTTKMRIFENSLLEMEKDYANISFVSNLDRSLQHLDKAMKTDIQSIQSELSPRVELLQERCALSQDVAELNKTLRNHAFQINALNTDLLDIQKICDGEPPAVTNGMTVEFERKPLSNVRYQCDIGFVMSRNSPVVCQKGKWEGQPPVCSFFDGTFYLRSYINGKRMTCYSVDNYRQIDISWVLDNGSGAPLPGNAIKQSETGLVDVRLSDVRYGSSQCGFRDERGSMNAIVHLQGITGDLYFVDHSKVANIGDAVVLEVKFNKIYSIRWRHNGVDVPSWSRKERVEIPSVLPTDSGKYECYYEGRGGETAPALLKLIVRKCKKNLFGERCDQQCPPCYNGGICHDHFGVCVCPSGFTGNNCEVACGEARYGADCSRSCDDNDCNRELFCHPDPYGCSCAPGWKGVKCAEKCDKGWYGAECKQICHCAGGLQSCNIFTGACSGGCSPGWTGQSCQIQGLNSVLQKDGETFWQENTENSTDVEMRWRES